jgi:HD-GYP domain-containing protein (c-di-GMP phosphodiesterase class II)
MDISFFGRLCAVADSFAAMTSTRPHAKAMAPGEAAAELVRDEKRYDSRITKALAALIMTEQVKG